jgi:hypothetical protein
MSDLKDWGPPFAHLVNAGFLPLISDHEYAFASKNSWAPARYYSKKTQNGYNDFRSPHPINLSIPHQYKKENSGLESPDLLSLLSLTG